MPDGKELKPKSFRIDNLPPHTRDFSRELGGRLSTEISGFIGKNPVG